MHRGACRCIIVIQVTVCMILVVGNLVKSNNGQATTPNNNSHTHRRTDLDLPVRKKLTDCLSVCLCDMRFVSAFQIFRVQFQACLVIPWISLRRFERGHWGQWSTFVPTQIGIFTIKRHIQLSIFENPKTLNTGIVYFSITTSREL
jgi:hypothetical protein